jgi:hypothetical protein
MKIGPYDVKILYKDAPMHKARVENDITEAVGFCSPELQQILIAPEQGDDSKADTLLHEILHYIFYITGGSNEFGNETEEKMIMHIGSTLLDTLRRNPQATKYLLGE